VNKLEQYYCKLVSFMVNQHSLDCLFVRFANFKYNPTKASLSTIPERDRVVGSINSSSSLE